MYDFGEIIMQCQKCGQINNSGSNFCRSCGTPFQQTQKKDNFEYAPPRPYVWKTDEFQMGKSQAKKSLINQVQPFSNQQTATAAQFNAQPAINPQQHQWVAYGYRCPRCSSQLMPKVEKRISTGGWVVFAIFLVAFFPLFWIGLLIKEEVKICPVCAFRVG